MKTALLHLQPQMKATEKKKVFLGEKRYPKKNAVGSRAPLTTWDAEESENASVRPSSTLLNCVASDESILKFCESCIMIPNKTCIVMEEIESIHNVH